MANFSYLADTSNLARDSVGAVATASTTAAGYLASDALKLPVAKPWRSTDLSAVTFEVDLLSNSAAFTIVGLRNHNLTSAATVTVKRGNTSPASTSIGAMTWREFDMFLKTGAQTNRYVLFTITDTANPDGFLSIGNVMIGTHVVSAFNYRYEGGEMPEISSRRHESAYYSPNVERLAEREVLDYRFQNLTATNRTTLRTLYRTLGKDVSPMFFIPDDDVNDGYLMRFGNTPRFQADFTNAAGTHFSTNITLVEDGRGRRIAR